MNNPRFPDDPDLKTTPKQFLLYALVCYAAAAGLFLLLWALEQRGGETTIHWLIAFLYNIGGKWVVAGVFAAIGTLCLIAALMGDAPKSTDE